MPVLPPAVHRTIVAVDVEGFGSQHRINPHRVAVREGLYRVLRQAFHAATIPWSDCHHEDRGDGILILARPEVAKSVFVESLPAQLVEGLCEHNSTRPAPAQIRLRMALHAGEVQYDDHGVAGAAVNLTYRLLNAAPLTSALAGSPGVLALVTSSWFFEEVVQHSTAAHPNAYRRVRVRVKETETVGWVHLPDHPYPTPDTTVAAPLLVGLTTAVPHQPPAETAHFVGRVEELDQMSKLPDAPIEEGGTMVSNTTSGEITASPPDGKAPEGGSHGTTDIGKRSALVRVAIWVAIATVLLIEVIVVNWIYGQEGTPLTTSGSPPVIPTYINSEYQDDAGLYETPHLPPADINQPPPYQVGSGKLEIVCQVSNGTFITARFINADGVERTDRNDIWYRVLPTNYYLPAIYTTFPYGVENKTPPGAPFGSVIGECKDVPP
jgi:class 3 adenylate cyclase